MSMTPIILGENLAEIHDSAKKAGYSGYVDPDAIDIIVRFGEIPVNWHAFSDPSQPFTLFRVRPIYIFVHGYWMEEAKLNTVERISRRPMPLNK